MGGKDKKAADQEYETELMTAEDLTVDTPGDSSIMGQLVLMRKLKYVSLP